MIIYIYYTTYTSIVYINYYLGKCWCSVFPPLTSCSCFGQKGCEIYGLSENKLMNKVRSLTYCHCKRAQVLIMRNFQARCRIFLHLRLFEHIEILMRHQEWSYELAQLDWLKGFLCVRKVFLCFSAILKVEGPIKLLQNLFQISKQKLLTG